MYLFLIEWGKFFDYLKVYFINRMVILRECLEVWNLG